MLPALTAVACACVVATLVVALAGREDPASRAAAPPPVTASASSSAGPAALLAAWDARRAAAWAARDPAALARLYAAGSRTGATDVRSLRRYRERGLRVEGLTTQVLALEVVGRTPDRLVLRVTDRVVGGTALGGAAPVALPADRASTRTVVLVREDGSWVVSAVRDQDSAAASTSRTSSSSKS
ncbi:hypothetical protein GCM10023339_24990 [Alloalcanivorax gelatiniphagus]